MNNLRPTNQILVFPFAQPIMYPLKGTIAYDSFNRPDNINILGITDTSQIWQSLGGVWGISNNLARLVTTGGSRDIIVIESNIADCIVKATFLTTNTRLAARVTDGLNHILIITSGGISYKVYKVVADIATEIGDFSITPNLNDIVKLTLNGPNIGVNINGNDLGVIYETFNQTATKHGLTTTSLNSRWGNFSVEAI